MTNKIAIKIAANFEHNLDTIEQFLTESQALPAFDRLLDEITEKVIPNLERFPNMGRNFMRKSAKSVEVSSALQALQIKMNGVQLHEYLISDYLVLYACNDDTVYLLAIKHHRQLTFDFNSIWGSAGT